MVGSVQYRVAVNDHRPYARCGGGDPNICELRATAVDREKVLKTYTRLFEHKSRLKYGAFFGGTRQTISPVGDLSAVDILSAAPFHSSLQKLSALSGTTISTLCEVPMSVKTPSV